MLKAARYVFAELREKNILNKAFSYFDGYTVSELDRFYEYSTSLASWQGMGQRVCGSAVSMLYDAT